MLFAAVGQCASMAVLAGTISQPSDKAAGYVATVFLLYVWTQAFHFKKELLTGYQVYLTLFWESEWMEFHSYSLLSWLRYKLVPSQ